MVTSELNSILTSLILTISTQPEYNNTLLTHHSTVDHHMATLHMRFNSWCTAHVDDHDVHNSSTTLAQSELRAFAPWTRVETRRGPRPTMRAHRACMPACLHVCVCVYVCVCVCVCVCALKHTYAHSYIYLYIHMPICTYTYTYIYSYIYILIHTYAHTYTLSYICSYIHTYTHTYACSNMHMHIHTYAHAYI